LDAPAGSAARRHARPAPPARAPGLPQPPLRRRAPPPPLPAAAESDASNTPSLSATVSRTVYSHRQHGPNKATTNQHRVPGHVRRPGEVPIPVTLHTACKTPADRCALAATPAPPLHVRTDPRTPALQSAGRQPASAAARVVARAQGGTCSAATSALCAAAAAAAAAASSAARALTSASTRARTCSSSSSCSFTIACLSLRARRALLARALRPDEPRPWSVPAACQQQNPCSMTGKRSKFGRPSVGWYVRGAHACAGSAESRAGAERGRAAPQQLHPRLVAVGLRCGGALLQRCRRIARQAALCGAAFGQVRLRARGRRSLTRRAPAQLVPCCLELVLESLRCGWYHTSAFGEFGRIHHYVTNASQGGCCCW